MTHPVTGRTRMMLMVGLLLVVGIAGASVMVYSLTSRGDKQEQRADQNFYTAVQLCEQVRQLGGACVVDPETLRGEPGVPGPAGPGPTDAQVAAAVASYLRANPPASGRAPTDAEISAAVAAWLTANPPSAGPRGETGPQGEQGPAGPGPTDEQIAAAVAAWLAANPPPHCPAGSHVEEYRPPLDKRTMLVCVKDAPPAARR